jgi:hypothetical protein
LAIALAVASIAGCGSQTPLASSTRCRRYATALSYGPQNQYTGTCGYGVYNAGTYDCRLGCSLRLRVYASLSDFIDEASVPNRARAIEVSSSVTCGLANTGGYTSGFYTYDGQKRLAKIEWRSRYGYALDDTLAVTQYTEWDGRGRPLAGTGPWRGGTVDIRIVYDDVARTMATSYGDGLGEYIVRQDAFGNTIGEGDVSYTVTQTAEVCQ